ncbi:MAG: hypothetical protein AB7G48_17390 [Nitrospiraceae bacterium]
MAGSTTRVARRKERSRRVLMEVGPTWFDEKSIDWTKIEDITEQADGVRQRGGKLAAQIQESLKVRW